MPRTDSKTLATLAARALLDAGATDTMARATALALVDADLDGLPTHGVARLELYVSMLNHGRAIGSAQPNIAHQKGAVTLIDAAHGLAYEASAMAIAAAIDRAREYGVAWSGVTNSGHNGVLGYHLKPVGAIGLVGMAWTNSPAAIPAWGGTVPLYGTNPVAAIFPRQGGPPLVIDLSLTTVTRGRIMLAAQRGEPIPEGWALDAAGRPTTDAKAALAGSMFPVGGAKGAALALAFELLCAALTGANFGYEADSFFQQEGNRPRIGHGFLVIDPDALAGREVYLERVEALVDALLADPGTRLPGESRRKARERAEREGIEIAETTLATLKRLAGIG